MEEVKRVVEKFVQAVVVAGAVALFVSAAEPMAESVFTVKLPESRFATNLLPDSPFGINTAFEPDTRDLAERLAAMQHAGIKWGRQDFTWKRIEKQPGIYDWSGYDRLVDQCLTRGVLLDRKSVV